MRPAIAWAVASLHQISPQPAAPITRAATFTASPITVYSLRAALPTLPAKTVPGFRPMRCRSAASWTARMGEASARSGLVYALTGIADASSLPVSAAMRPFTLSSRACIARAARAARSAWSS